MSVSKPIKSAGQGEYYLKLAAVDDYYLESQGEPPGFWLGAGAKILQLAGYLKKADFRNLLRGRSPDGKTPLVKNPTSSRRCGWDLTWSVPKSVSVIWSQAEPSIRVEIESAVRCAAGTGVAYLETIGIVSRRGENGIHRDAANLIFACFEHSTSRALDPQLHVHTILLNVGIRPDGSTGTLDTRLLFRHQLAAGALFRAELAAQLETRLGFKAIRVERSFEILGVSKALIDRFSQRRAEIEAELKRRGLSGARASEAVTLETRSRKTQVSRGDLFRIWQSVGRELKWTSQQVGWLVDRKPPSRNRERDQAAVQTEGITTLTQHQSHFSSRELLWSMALAAQTRCLSAASVQSLAQAVINSPAVVPLTEFRSEFQWTTPEVLALEAKVLETARAMMAQARPTGVVAQDSKLNDEQNEALGKLCAEIGGLLLLRGGAGTGKSTLFRAASEVWRTQGQEVFGAALTGKAARGLGDAAGIPADTLHSTLERLKTKQLRLHRDAVVIIDEAAMVGTRQMAEVLERCHTSGSRLILAGDERQLQPIELGGAFAALARELKAAELIKNLRQQDAWTQEAVADFAAGRAHKALNAYAIHGLVHEHESVGTATEALVGAWIKSTSTTASATDPGNSAPAPILASTNEDVSRINQAIQTHRLAAGQITEPGVTVADETLFIGDRILLTRNLRRLEIMNGDLGTIRSTGNDRLQIHLDTGRHITLDPKSYHYIHLGYALTVHKSQGITVDNAYVLAGSHQTRELAYVAASRARHRSEWHFDESASTTARRMSDDRKKNFAKELLQRL